jgi:hypothetical protein
MRLLTCIKIPYECSQKLRKVVKLPEYSNFNIKLWDQKCNTTWSCTKYIKIFFLKIHQSSSHIFRIPKRKKNAIFLWYTTRKKIKRSTSSTLFWIFQQQYRYRCEYSYTPIITKFSTKFSIRYEEPGRLGIPTYSGYTLRSEIEAPLITREVLLEIYFLSVIMAAAGAQAGPFLQFRASCSCGTL